MPHKRTSWMTLLAAALAISTAGCATTPVSERLVFSDALIRDYKLTDVHKPRLQYYSSDRITLVRSASGSLRGIAEGKLIERGNTLVRGIEIPADAPGVVVGAGPNWLAVSFEPGSYLYFVSGQSRVNSPHWDDEREAERYYLYAPDWDGRAGSVRIGDTSYQAVEGSIDVFLTVGRETLFKASSQSRIQPGRWLDDRPPR